MNTASTIKPAVLIADDEPGCRAMIAAALEEQGYPVEIARNGVEALERLKSNSDVGIAITDIIMPEKEGIGLIRSIRRMFPAVKIIVVTGSVNFESVSATARDFGADVTIRKPFDIEHLMEIVEEYAVDDKEKRGAR